MVKKYKQRNYASKYYHKISIEIYLKKCVYGKIKVQGEKCKGII